MAERTLPPYSIAETTVQSRGTDPHIVGLHDLSLEIGVRDLEALDRNRGILPDGGRIFVNAVSGQCAATRIRMAEKLAARGFRPVLHIAARRIPSEEELKKYLGGLVGRAGVREILVVGGDLGTPLGPYSCALDVISSGLPAKLGIERIGLAGYPDGHPKISSSVLHQALEDKLAACAAADLVPYVVTQFSFQAKAISDWCRQTHAAHPDLAIHVGIPGPTKLGTLIRFARLCGVQSSLNKLLESRKTAINLLRRTSPWVQLETIGQYRMDSGRPLGCHVFTFGGLSETAKWLREIGDRNKL